MSELAANQISTKSDSVFSWTNRVGIRGFFLGENNKIPNKPYWIVLIMKRDRLVKELIPWYTGGFALLAVSKRLQQLLNSSLALSRLQIFPASNFMTVNL